MAERQATDSHRATADRLTYRVAVIGVAVALVAFLIMAGIVLALGEKVANEYWTAGGAVGGALLGILTPTPKNALSRAQRQASKAHTAAAKVHADAAAKAADASAPTKKGSARAARDATDHANQATAHAAGAAAVTSYIPGALLLALFIGSTTVWLTVPEPRLQAFAAASGTALPGLLAPSPGQAAGASTKAPKS